MHIQTKIDAAAATPVAAPKTHRTRHSLGLVGAGAFGRFCLPHLAPHFDVVVADASENLSTIAAEHWVRVGDLAAAARAEIVVLAVPLGALEAVAKAIAPHLRPGALVIDVCSVKLKPLEILQQTLPAHVTVIGTHPLFGPQSGKAGIAGLNLAVCAPPSPSRRRLMAFANKVLGLNAVAMSADAHDRQMAHVQGLTHLVARTLMAMDMPVVAPSTATYELMLAMVEMVRHDSPDLFRVITQENPYVRDVTTRFAHTAAALVGEPVRR